MTKDEMLTKVVPLMKHADDAAIRDALEIAFNCGMSAGFAEARAMINAPRAAEPNGDPQVKP